MAITESTSPRRSKRTAVKVGVVVVFLSGGLLLLNHAVERVRESAEKAH